MVSVTVSYELDYIFVRMKIYCVVISCRWLVGMIAGCLDLVG